MPFSFSAKLTFQSHIDITFQRSETHRTTLQTKHFIKYYLTLSDIALGVSKRFLLMEGFIVLLMEGFIVLSNSEADLYITSSIGRINEAPQVRQMFTLGQFIAI